jgi:hypothetical protein
VETPSFTFELELRLRGEAGAVERFGGVPPYAETQEYVRRVQSYAAGFRAGGPNPSQV